MRICEQCRTTILLAALCASSALAQVDQQSPAPSPDTMKPDTRPLAGAESITLGSVVGERSYLLPGFLVAQSADSNPQLQVGGQSGFGTATVLAGRLALQRLGRRNEFAAAYQGGGIIYERNTQLDSTYHLAAFSDSLLFRRASLTISDQFSFLPGYYAGIGGLSYGGVFSLGNLGNLPALNSSFVPGRGILTSAEGYSNTALAQVAYRPGERSTLTMVGAFQTLSSTQSGFVSGNSAVFQGGYDRNLTSRDTVAVFYSAGLFRFSGIAESIDSNFIAFSYGRRITGRLAFQVFGGPEIFTVTVPGQSRTETLAGGGANLTYRWPRTQASLFFRRGVTGGSGVLTGAETYSTTATLSRQLSRAWWGGLNAGYYYNSLVPTPTSRVTNLAYEYWQASANLTRILGRYARLSLFYAFQTQNSNQAFTTGSTTGKSVERNLFGVTLNFNYRPLGI